MSGNIFDCPRQRWKQLIAFSRHFSGMGSMCLPIYFNFYIHFYLKFYLYPSIGMMFIERQRHVRCMPCGWNWFPVVNVNSIDWLQSLAWSFWHGFSRWIELVVSSWVSDDFLSTFVGIFWSLAADFRPMKRPVNGKEMDADFQFKISVHFLWLAIEIFVSFCCCFPVVNQKGSRLIKRRMNYWKMDVKFHFEICCLFPNNFSQFSDIIHWDFGEFFLLSAGRLSSTRSWMKRRMD